MKKISVIRKYLCIGLAFLCTGIIGYLIGTTAPYSATTLSTNTVVSSESSPNLQLSITYDPEANWSDLLVENTKNSFTKVSLKNGISQANIVINGNTFSLADALTKGIITQAEIAYLARSDAEAGYCEQTHETQNGLTHFTYHYPNFNLRVIYDIYVTPDGGQDLIDHITIYPARENEHFGAYTNFYDPETGLLTDLENWGLTFTTVETTPTGLTLHCQQSEGQQIGQLSIDWYYLFNSAGFNPNSENPAESPLCEVSINMDGETTFTLDWSEIYGELPSGEYTLTLNVIDHFDESQIHPLMQDYHDWQVYDISFFIE